ncbi:MAG TPA: alpha/beta hydrolase [Candidatus Obscuribacter sp.]|nr:alpha/beta hydrolase [Candidatus Obscuribacter sp.]HMX45830.1 alpha/beta hydrolase [Candidatus Obscuribacter sp.]HMY55882.1 alpha/beta hydrolase [Candidatus Obscuribacter sp.]HNB17976.1 alpha/beta hydrolase [Candidatus Obscuribacter sp.]
MPKDGNSTIGRKILRLTLFFFAVVALVIASTYLFFAPVFHSDYIDSMLLHPLKNSADAPVQDQVLGIRAEAAQVPVSHGDKEVLISAAHYKLPHPKGLVIFSHGTGGNIDIRFSKQNPRLSMLLKQGLEVLLYDYEGYGRSPGKASLRNLKDDCLAVYNYALKLGFKPENIFLYGESLGGGVSCMLAQEKPVRAIILDCTFTSPERLAKELMPLAEIYPSFLFPEPRLDNLHYLQGNHPPCLIVAGKKDPTIPSSQSILLRRMAKPSADLLILPESYHCYLAESDLKTFEATLSKFLNKLI